MWGTLRRLWLYVKLLVEFHSNLVLMFESRLDGAWACSVRMKLAFDNCFVVDSVGYSRGLILLWYDDWDVSILSCSSVQN